MRTPSFALQTAVLVAALHLQGRMDVAGAAPANSNNAPKVPTSGVSVGTSALDGMYVSNGQVFVARHGEIERLVAPAKLKNGVRVAPDGTVTTQDGRTRMLRGDQIVTFSGTIERLQRPSTVVHAVPARPLDGIIVSLGRAYLVHRGRSDRLRSDYRLPTGAVVQPDGLVRMPDGTSFLLGTGQMITFSGRIRNPGNNPAGNSPIANYPRNPNAATTGESQFTVSGSEMASPPVSLPGQGTSAR